MTCLRERFKVFTDVIAKAEKVALDNKCNMVVVSINKKWLYDKESCWVRDGSIGELVKLIEYDKL